MGIANDMMEAFHELEADRDRIFESLKDAQEIARKALEQRDEVMRDGCVLAMRVLQSDLVLDDEERSAMERFLPKSLKA